MGLFDDYFDPDQFQDSGGLLGRLLSLRPDLDSSQSNDGVNSQSPFEGASFASQVLSPPVVPQISPNAASSPLVAAMSALDPAQNAVASGGVSQAPSFDDANASPSAPPAFDLGAHLNAGFQSWAQTPAGSPFAAIANGISGFNAAQPTDAAFIGPPAPISTQTPEFGDRLGAAFQSWAQTPVGSPFAALANGITGFHTGQTSVTPAALSATPAQAQAPNSGDRSNGAIQNPQNAFAANANPLVPIRRPPLLRRWPQ